MESVADWLEHHIGMLHTVTFCCRSAYSHPVLTFDQVGISLSFPLLKVQWRQNLGAKMCVSGTISKFEGKCTTSPFRSIGDQQLLQKLEDHYPLF